MSTSASKSAATTSTTSTTTDRRIAADNGALVLGDGAKVETLADDVAIEALQQAGNVAEVGLSAGVHLGNIAADAAKTINADSLDFAGTIVDSASSLLTRQIQATEKAAGNVSDVAALALAGMERNQADPANTTVQDVAKYAAVAAVAVGAVYLITRKN